VTTFNDLSFASFLPNAAAHSRLRVGHGVLGIRSTCLINAAVIGNVESEAKTYCVVLRRRRNQLENSKETQKVDRHGKNPNALR
jgi:hypothetical protein